MPRAALADPQPQLSPHPPLGRLALSAFAPALALSAFAPALALSAFAPALALSAFAARADSTTRDSETNAPAASPSRTGAFRGPLFGAASKASTGPAFPFESHGNGDGNSAASPS